MTSLPPLFLVLELPLFSMKALHQRMEEHQAFWMWPSMEPDNSTALSADGYHKYKEDIKVMSDTGLEAYRFSISWSRLLPYGRGTVNEKGVQYYNSVLEELAKRGIPAHVTLNHLDIPQVLQDEYGGWLSPKIVKDFKEFADVCFREFGSKVSHWTTITEPNIIGLTGDFVPHSWCSPKFETINCYADSSADWIYIKVHNMLIAHSEAVRLYRTKYQRYQGGWIGLNIYSFWCQPFSNSSADLEATLRVKSFMFDWVLSPVTIGDYPELMKSIASTRLPSFTNSQSEVLKGSFDFMAINYYASGYISDNSNSSKAGASGFQADMAAIMRVNKNDPPTMGPFLPTRVPEDFSGLEKMLHYLKEKYGNPPIYIHENGFAAGLENVLNDTARIAYLEGYIGSTLEASRSGVQVRGYFVWSFLDVYEFLGGYKKGFGLYHVDFDDEKRHRTPKLSAHWYSSFLKNNVSVVFSIESAGLEATSLYSQ
ncbi:beta-glucosidase 22-like isoform X2 [Phalaenopsis equestris]|uniref:beta-glucosidase 22-like isoform X2 n=1 Tax=Phalaenopsis equestris TaxID=78828 RepID=UPI0009E22073|nr:beta-glucosidase 22-like isoform X2 [Phalaenopsis equestris]